MKKYVYLLLALLFLRPAITKAAEKITNSSGELNNVVVLVEFDDDKDYFDQKLYSLLHHSYNAAGEFDVSASNYFKQISCGKLKFKGLFADSLKGGKTVKLSKKRSWFLPQNYSDGAPTGIDGGYDNNYYSDGKKCLKSDEGAKKHIDCAVRENLMIREILSKIKPLEGGAALDNDGDGAVDNVTFILSGNVFFKDNKNIWGEILWPHMASVESFESIEKKSYCPNGYLKEAYGDLSPLKQTPVISGKEVKTYNILSAAYMFNTTCQTYRPGDTAHIGVICHELMHALGIMDYYSYEPSKNYSPVGKFDLMASTSKNPQYMLSFLRLKMGWLDENQITAVTKGGEFTLYPVSSQKSIKALKVKPAGFDTSEFFMIEARSDKCGLFDRSMGGTGLIIYRVDPAAAEKNGFLGNMYGNDEIYVFRRYDIQNGGYFATADSGLLENGQSYGSAAHKPSVESVFYQGTDNEKLKNINSGIEIYKISINSDLSVTFNLSLNAKKSAA